MQMNSYVECSMHQSPVKSTIPTNGPSEKLAIENIVITIFSFTNNVFYPTIQKNSFLA